MARTPHGQLGYGLAELTDSQTIPSLRQLGVKYVIVDRHKELHNGVKPTIDRFAGLSRLISEQGQQLFRVVPGPDPPAAVTEVSGFPWTLPGVPRVERYMSGTSAVLGLWIFQHGASLRISFDAQSWSQARQVAVTQGAKTLWAGRVNTIPRRISFITASASLIHIHCRPGVTTPGITLTVDVTGFQVQRA